MCCNPYRVPRNGKCPYIRWRLSWGSYHEYMIDLGDIGRLSLCQEDKRCNLSSQKPCYSGTNGPLPWNWLVHQHLRNSAQGFFSRSVFSFFLHASRSLSQPLAVKLSAPSRSSLKGSFSTVQLIEFCNFKKHLQSMESVIGITIAVQLFSKCFEQAGSPLHPI